MKARDLPALNPTELRIMKLLWNRHRLSAREIHQELVEDSGWAYTTTRTTVERMVKKGYVRKGDFHGLGLYEAGISRVLGLARLVEEFAQRVVELDVAPVVSLFAQGQALTEAEIEELSALIESAEEEDR